MKRREPNRSKGFTLIELLIVVAIIGIIAAIAIPNLKTAIDKGKGKSTLANMRQIMQAVEMYQIDHSHYPAAANIQQLQQVLEPDYMTRLPVNDGWKHAIVYLPSSPPGVGYTIRSPGKDGVAQAVISGGSIASYDADIVIVNGAIVQEQGI